MHRPTKKCCLRQKLVPAQKRHPAVFCVAMMTCRVCAAPHSPLRLLRSLIVCSAVCPWSTVCAVKQLRFSILETIFFSLCDMLIRIILHTTMQTVANGVEDVMLRPCLGEGSTSQSHEFYSLNQSLYWDKHIGSFNMSFKDRLLKNLYCWE